MSGRRKSSDQTLSDRQRRFVDEYLIDLNVAAAARRSGYAASTAHAPDKLISPAVAAAIELAKADRARRTRLQADLVVTELARLAFANLYDFIGVEPDGAPRIDFRGITRDDAAALQSITVDYYRPAPVRWRDKQPPPQRGGGGPPADPGAQPGEERVVEGESQAPERPPEPPPFQPGAAPPRRIRIALHDKRAALRELSQHLGLITAGEAAAKDAEPDILFQRIVTGVPRAHDPDGNIGIIRRYNPDGSYTHVDEAAVIHHYVPRGDRKRTE